MYGISKKVLKGTIGTGLSKKGVNMSADGYMFCDRNGEPTIYNALDLHKRPLTTEEAATISQPTIGWLEQAVFDGVEQRIMSLATDAPVVVPA